MPNIAITDVTPQDVEQVLTFIRDLAKYEKLSSEVIATTTQLRRNLFGSTRYARAMIARLDGEPAGFALYFTNFSTFLAKPGIYLEDLFVGSAHRGLGVGKALLRRLAQEAVKIGAGRLEWSVLDWNEPAIAFYRSIGARAMDEWTVFRLDGDALSEFAQVEPGFQKPPRLDAHRFTLRAGELKDAPAITALLQDPDIAKNLGGIPTPFLLADAEVYLASIGARSDYYDWLLDHPVEGVLGTIHMSVTPRHGVGYLGFWIGKPFWGNGFMPEAISRVLEFAFLERGLNRVEAEHFASNLASGRAMEKAGMRLEGVRRGSFVKDDRVLDVVLYGITREDRANAKAATP